jgi:MFS family permease
MIIGGLGGMAGLVLTGVIASAVATELSDNFEDNGLTWVGFWICGVIGVIACAVLGGLLSFYALTLATGLLCAKPILTVVVLLVLGPLLIIAGKVNWRKPNWSRIKSALGSRLPVRKPKPVQEPIAIESQPSETDKIIDEVFQTIDYEGVTLHRVK